MSALPKLPTSLFTVASVDVPVTFAEPSKAADVQLTSPVIPIVLGVANTVAFAESPEKPEESIVPPPATTIDCPEPTCKLPFMPGSWTNIPTPVETFAVPPEYVKEPVPPPLRPDFNCSIALSEDESLFTVKTLPCKFVIVSVC